MALIVVVRLLFDFILLCWRVADWCLELSCLNVLMCVWCSGVLIFD